MEHRHGTRRLETGKGALKEQTVIPSKLSCSFSWSIASMLTAMGLDVPASDIAGYSLNAFAVWAHPGVPVSQWAEEGCEMFTEFMFRSLSLRGEILSVPAYDYDLLHHFIRHWSARVQASLNASVPVAARGAWPDAVWGIITAWNKDKRVLKGRVPGHRRVSVNTCWPDKIVLAAGPALKPEPEIAVKWVLERAAALGGNRLEHEGWVSGIDAYVLWCNRIRDRFGEEEASHRNLARHIAEARRYATRFLTRHADMHEPGVERMMLALARHYDRSSAHLADAAYSGDKQDFVCEVTLSLAEEEKALVLTEEILFHLD